MLVLEAAGATTAAIAVADSKATRLGSGRMLKIQMFVKNPNAIVKLQMSDKLNKLSFNKGMKFILNISDQIWLQKWWQTDGTGAIYLHFARLRVCNFTSDTFSRVDHSVVNCRISIHSLRERIRRETA